MIKLLQNIPLGYYAFSGLANFLTAFIISLIVFFSDKKSKANRIFAIFSLSVAYWSFLYFIWLITKNKVWAEFYLRSCMIGVLFMPSLFIHFVLFFLNLKINRKFIVANYILSILVMFTVYSPLYARDIGRHLVFPYWLHTGPIFHVALIHFGAVVLYSFYLMSKSIKKEKGIFRNQILYVFIGTAVGYISGVTNFFCWYRIKIPPFLNIFVSVYVIMTAIAVLRYRLMDINLALTRAGIFIVVYLFVLGIPFILGYRYDLWRLATWIMFFLATSGPFIYTYLRRQAEERMLREERHSHQLLMQGSSGMTQIRDLRKLLSLIVHFVPKIMKVRNASIFLLDSELTQYLCEAVRFKDNPTTLRAIDVNDPLILYLKEKKAPLVYEEVKSHTHDKQFPKSEILSQMKNLSASVILPCFIEDAILGFLILDEKKSGRMYTPQDLNVLTTLTNQAALAFENAQFYCRDRENQALLYQSATLADMGVMADSMGHQIKNHIQKMMAEAGGNAGILEELLKQGIDDNKAQELLKRQIDVLYGIEKQGEAGGKLIESISKFSRIPKAAFRDITLKEILDTANDILRFKVKFDEIDYNIQIPDNLPTLYAHPILSEAFVNLIDNAYDAIREKEQGLELEAKKTGQSISYRGSISFTATQQNNSLEIQVKDNGIGIKKENIPHLFLPFYTTKATSAKGTGLGLFVIKKIVSNHKGKIKIDSAYMQGTTFTITIPIRQER